MEKTTSLKEPTRIYNYRLYITDGEPELKEMLRRARWYYNDLVSIQNERYLEFCGIRARATGIADFDGLEKQVLDLDEQIKELIQEKKQADSRHAYAEHTTEKSNRAGKQQARTDRRTVATGYQERIQALKDVRKPLYTQLSEAKKAFNASLGPANLAFSERVKALAGSNKSIQAKAKRTVLDEMVAEGQWPSVWVEVKQNDLKAEDAKKLVRLNPKEPKYTGVEKPRGLGAGTWGTYTAVQDSVIQAAKTSKSPVLKYKSFDGSGRIGATQITGMTMKELFSGADPRIGLTLCSLEGHHNSRQQKKGYRVANGHMKIEGGEHPTNVRFKVRLHRPMPETGLIAGAFLMSERIGNTTRYYLQVAVQDKSHQTATTGSGTVAINLGWRATEHGIRIGATMDDRGNSHEFYLRDMVGGRDTLRALDTHRHIQRLRGFSDQHYDTARDAVIGWKASNPVPEWVAEKTKGMNEKWRSHKSLAGVVTRWANELFDEDRLLRMWKTWQEFALSQDLFLTQQVTTEWAIRTLKLDPTQAFVWWLYTWERKNSHLYAYECGARRRLIAHRNDLYRRFASQLASEYETLLIDDTNLAELAKIEPQGEGTRLLPRDEQEEAAAFNRTVAGVYQLRIFLKERFGANYKKLPGVSGIHHACGGILDKAARKQEIHVHCSKCERPVDQDVNLAQNLLTDSNTPFQQDMAAE